jgi:sugar/nucleoside kinase (ribokinase family)
MASVTVLGDAFVDVVVIRALAIRSLAEFAHTVVQTANLSHLPTWNGDATAESMQAACGTAASRMLRVAHASPRSSIHSGGSSGNTAIQLAKLGVDTQYATGQPRPAACSAGSLFTCAQSWATTRWATSFSAGWPRCPLCRRCPPARSSASSCAQNGVKCDLTVRDPSTPMATCLVLSSKAQGERCFVNVMGTNTAVSASQWLRKKEIIAKVEHWLLECTSDSPHFCLAAAERARSHRGLLQLPRHAHRRPAVTCAFGSARSARVCA